MIKVAGIYYHVGFFNISIGCVYISPTLLSFTSDSLIRLAFDDSYVYLWFRSFRNMI